MNDYASLRKKKNSTFMAVVALVLCVALSAAFLFSRLASYSAHRTLQYIPLTVSNGVTHVTTLPKAQPQADAPMVQKLSSVVNLDETKPSNEQDGETWLTMTDLELFKVSYENGEGQVTVQSNDGSQIVAPGTSNSFTFSLLNTSDTGLDYTIEVEAYFTIEGGDQGVPVQLRLSDYNGNYLIGGPDSFADLSEVNVADGNGSVSAGYIVPYTIEWQWPFEGDDELDTYLGSLFVEAEAEVSFVMVVRTTAVQGGEGGMPDTGDADGVLIAGGVLAVSFVSLVFLLVPKRKREEDDAQN